MLLEIFSSALNKIGKYTLSFSVINLNSSVANLNANSTFTSSIFKSSVERLKSSSFSKNKCPAWREASSSTAFNPAKILSCESSAKPKFFAISSEVLKPMPNTSVIN